jgi:hypothetical protein
MYMEAKDCLNKKSTRNTGIEDKELDRWGPMLLVVEFYRM